MSSAYDCCGGCPTAEITEVPGSPGTDGAAGAAGTDGQNAYTVTTIALDLPGAPGPVVSPAVVTFASTSWMSLGQVIFISDGTDWAHFSVDTLPSTTTATLTWLGYAGDAAAGTNIATAATVSPSGTQPPLSAALPTALTDNTTGTASNTLAAGVGVQHWFFTHTFISGTAAVEPVTTWVPGFAFKILGWHTVTSALLVGAAGSRVANMEIGGTDVGTVPSTVTIPIANAALGTVTAGTAVAGANTGSASDSFSIEIAAGGTEFTAGIVTFVVQVQNMDEANAAASLADHVNDLITSLT